MTRFAHPSRAAGCVCGDAAAERGMRRLEEVAEAAMALARIVGRKAIEEANAEADRLDAAHADAPPAAAPLAPPASEAPASEPPAPEAVAAAPARLPQAAPPRPSGPRSVTWCVLFLRISREVRRIVALEAGIDAGQPGSDFRPPGAQSADPVQGAHGPPAGPEGARRARVRDLAREAAAADPGDHDLQTLLADIDALLDDGRIEIGLAAGDAVADLAADICEDLDIAFDFQGLAAEDLATGPPAPPWRPP